MGHLPAYGAHCALDSVGHMGMAINTYNMILPPSPQACQTASETETHTHTTQILL